MVADEVVRVAHHARGADGDRLLADAAVRGAEDDALPGTAPPRAPRSGGSAPSAGTARASGGRSAGRRAASRRVTLIAAAAGGTRRCSRRGRARRGSCRPRSAPAVISTGPSERNETPRARGRRGARRCRDEHAEVPGAVVARPAARQTCRSQPRYSISSTSSVAAGDAQHRDVEPRRLGHADDPGDLGLLVEPAPEQLEAEQAAVELERAVEVGDGDPRVPRPGDRPRAHAG